MGKPFWKIGAGKGFFAQQPPFAPEMLIYTEISFNRFRMNRYKAIFPDKSFGVFNDANTPCFKTGCFDYIVFVNCLMFVNNKVQLLEHYKSLLKETGALIVIEPLSDNPFYKIRKIFTSDYEHIKARNMTYRELEEICEKSAALKKGYFYFLSILTASLILKFPHNAMIKHIHTCIESFDRYILNSTKANWGAMLGCAVIAKSPESD